MTGQAQGGSHGAPARRSQRTRVYSDASAAARETLLPVPEGVVARPSDVTRTDQHG